MIPIGMAYTAAFLASTQKAALTKASHSIGRCISLSQKALDNAERMKTMTMMTMIRVVAMMDINRGDAGDGHRTVRLNDVLENRSFAECTPHQLQRLALPVPLRLRRLLYLCRPSCHCPCPPLPCPCRPCPCRRQAGQADSEDLPKKQRSRPQTTLQVPRSSASGLSFLRYSHAGTQAAWSTPKGRTGGNDGAGARWELLDADTTPPGPRGCVGTVEWTVAELLALLLGTGMSTAEKKPGTGARVGALT